MSRLLCAILLAASVLGASAADITPAKQALIDHLFKVWSIDSVGVKMLSDPVAEIMRQSRSLLQGRVSEEKRDATMKLIAEDARKYLEENIPLVRADSDKLLQSTVAPILAEKFSDEELKQIIAMYESPVKAKFESLIPEMQRALGTKLAEQDGPTIKPKIDALNQKIGERMKEAVTAN